MGGMAIAGYGASGPEFLDATMKSRSGSSISGGVSTGGMTGPGTGTAPGLLTKDGVTRPTMNQAQAAAQFASLPQAQQSDYLNQLAAGPGGVAARQAFVDQYLGGVTPAGATMSPKTATAAKLPNQGPYAADNQVLNEIFADQPVSTGTGLNTGSTISTGGVMPSGGTIEEIFAEQPVDVEDLTFGSTDGLPLVTGAPMPTGTNIEEIFAEQPLVVPEKKFGDLITNIGTGLENYATDTLNIPEEILVLGKELLPLDAVDALTGLPSFVMEGVGGLDLTTDFTSEELEQLQNVDLTASSTGDTLYTPEGGVGSTGTGGPFDIANAAAIRSVVPGTYDPNRRAGSGGQRYFSDIRYAPQEGIAGAQAAANAQAMMLAYQNATNPAYQARPGATVDRATSMAQRAAGLAGLVPTTLTGSIPTSRTTTPVATTPVATTPVATTPAATTPAATTPAATTPAATTPAATTPAATTPAATSRKPKPFTLTAADGTTSTTNVPTRQAPTFVPIDPDGPVYGRVQSTPTEILEGINPEGGFSEQEQRIVANLLTSGQTDIGTVNEILGVETGDVLEGLLRGKFQTPAETAAMLRDYGNEGFTEVDLVANLLNTGRAKPEEVASYYRNTDANYADLTAQDVENELAKINEQNTLDYLTGLSDEEVGKLINDGTLPISQAVEVYQDRYPGLTEADVKAALKAQGYAQGGNVNGYYLGGTTDGMADQIPATINDMQPAALSDGEFVIPADVVSHLGNGNSDAGAKELYSMMDRIRRDRTGTTKQGKEIDPNKYLA